MSPSPVLALSSRARRAWAWTFAVTVALAGCTPNAETTARADASADWRVALERWSPGSPLPDIPLEDADGARRALRTLDGPLLLTFAFSRCAVPEACPMTLARLKAVQAAGVPVHAVVVTLDPAHDKGAVLRAWKARSGLDAATFLTGTEDAVDGLASCFNVFAAGIAPDLAHPVKAGLVGVDQRVRAVWTDNAFDAATVGVALRAATDVDPSSATNGAP